MPFIKISPFGPRLGYGTYETFFDKEKYSSMEEAKFYNDVAVVDFVRDEYGIIYFQAYSTIDPETFLYHKLHIQLFPFGIDYRDDVEVCNLVAKLWGKKIFDPSMN